MLLKLIECDVEPDNRSAFSRAQELWRDIADCAGFAGQFGGWRVNNAGPEARIFALWQTREAVERFMAGRHDEISDKNHQASTYTACRVHYLELVAGTLPDIAELDKVSHVQLSECSEACAALGANISYWQCPKSRRLWRLDLACSSAENLVMLEPSWLVLPAWQESHVDDQK